MTVWTQRHQGPRLRLIELPTSDDPGRDLTGRFSDGQDQIPSQPGAVRGQHDVDGLLLSIQQE
jgi:hypothetical protein